MSDQPATVDFGAPTGFGAHLFRVEIPASRNESVIIVEDYGYRGQEGGVPRDEERVVLKRPVWSAIADIARRGHTCYVRFAYGFESGFATSRRQSMKSCAAGLRVRFLRVTIPTGLG